MKSHEILVSACIEAADTWHYMARECEVFNKRSGLETAGHVARSMMTFGTGALISIPEIERRIEGHIMRLERSLYELRKRAERCSSLASGDDNIFQTLNQVEMKKFGSRQLLVCGFTDRNCDSEYACNIGEVAFHLLEAHSFWGSSSNSVQDIAQRHKMFCRSIRLLEEKSATPKLAAMPHTPISQAIKKFINSQIQTQIENIDEFTSTALTSIKQASKTRSTLRRFLRPDNIEALKQGIESYKAKTSLDKPTTIDVDAE